MDGCGYECVNGWSEGVGMCVDVWSEGVGMSVWTCGVRMWIRGE